MWNFGELLQNFFTHRDFLPPADRLPGTLFTPLHFVFAAVCILLVAVGCIYFSRKEEKKRLRIYGIIWGVVTSLEIVKILWESCSGTQVAINWVGILPLYPCSIFMYAMPFAIWGKGLAQRAARGYVCTLGLLGGLINFVYPANILGTYSCISFAGMHTFLYHGAIVVCALTMLLAKDHRYTGITKWWELLLPSMPFLIVSVVANAVNFSPVNADYMFFKLESFIFAPLGAALPHVAAVAITYCAYLLIHALPYLPSYFANCRKVKSGIAMLLAVMALSCLLPISANGAGTYTARLADAAGNSVVKAKPGDTVTLFLSIENNPGVICVAVEMQYPEALSLVSPPKNISVFKNVAEGMMVPPPKTNPNLMWWNYALGDYNKKLIYENGNMAEITFTVSANAKSGDYPITLTAPADKNTTTDIKADGTIVDDTNKPVKDIAVVGCTIRVEGDTIPDTTQPKPTTPETTKPTEGTTGSTEPTKATDPTSATTETTQPTTTESTQPTTGTVDTIETTDTQEETKETTERKPVDLKNTPAAVRILAALGIVLVTGGILFFVLKRKPGDYQD